MSNYTNIPDHEGIETVKEKLHNQSGTPTGDVSIKFLFLILTLNNFDFSSIIYLQIKGCPKKKTIIEHFFGKFESTHIYPYIRDKKIA